MKTLVTDTNILQTAVEFFKTQEEFQNLLDKGNLRGAEQLILGQIFRLVTELTAKLLQTWMTHNWSWLVSKYAKSGFKRCESRSFGLQIQTGEVIEVTSPYAKQIACEEPQKGQRHLFKRHFSIIGNGSPEYVSKVTMSGLMCPSYDVGNELLTQQGITQSETRVRKLTNEMADYCFDKEAALATGEQESLKGKRVIIGIDGGRCNTRENRTIRNAKGNLTYQTAWCEPKLFVIQTVDENGKLSQDSRPIYSGRFSDTDMWCLLKSYLIKLQINEAESVQILADGAPWIWNNIMPLLLELGVSKEKVVLTLDYFHASGYVNKLIEAMPKHINQKQRAGHLLMYKNWLWVGQSTKIVAHCRQIIKRPKEEVIRWLNYLEKHENKTNYEEYEEKKWMCGSGIIESGIRRVINLRFKNTGTFWQKKIVEKLFFLRGIFLAKRWDTLWCNIVKFEF
jgi:hypothetical protein